MTATLQQAAERDPGCPCLTCTVIDNPGYAWRNQEGDRLSELPDDFVDDYRTALDAAAVTAMACVLPEVWAERGYRFASATEDEMADPWRPGQPHDETYWAVWDEAAARIDPWALVDAAGLSAELAEYRARND